jgi:TPR repeat protein
LYGQGVNKDIVNAADWYQKSSGQGEDVSPSLEIRLGLMFEKGKDTPKDMTRAAEWYRKAADHDYGLAEFYLSLLYENGEGVAKDATRAEAWFQKAAAHGWEGKDDLNVFTTLSPDEDKSVEWFRRGAELGNASAQYRLGEIYESWMHEIYGYGSGVDNDYDKAFELYRKAAEQGYAKAQYSLGEMYRRGRGVAADADKAIEWYRKAAAHSDDQMQKSIRKAVEEAYAQGEVSTREGAASTGSPSDSDACLITATRMGPVRLGMKLGDARKVLPAAKFERTTDGEGLALVAVELGGEEMMVLYAGEQHENAPIDWSKRIENIETFDSRCHTAKAVHPYSPVRDVEKVFGKTRYILVSEIESREYIDFEKQPKYFLIRSDDVGIYPADNSRFTTKFKPDGRIMSIAISSN